VKVGGGWAVDRSSPHLSRMLRPAATLRCASGFTTGAETEKIKKDVKIQFCCFQLFVKGQCLDYIEKVFFAEFEFRI
jgi:hypothetical protein